MNKMFVQLESQLSTDDQNLISQDLKNIALENSLSQIQELSQDDNEVFNTPQTVTNGKSKFGAIPTDEDLKQDLGPMIKADIKEEEGVLLVVDNKEDIKPVDGSQDQKDDLAETITVTQPSTTSDIQLSNVKKQGCASCIADGHKYCFIKLSLRPGLSKTKISSPVSSGVGKCCHITDVSSPGCDPKAVKEMENDSEYQNYTLDLICSANQLPQFKSEMLISGIQSVYSTRGDSDQPIVTDSSQPYEMCPHIPKQCDAKDAIQANFYKNRQLKDKEIENINYFTNEPYKVNLTDNGEWENININSVDGTVCSYNFQHQNSASNVYQLIIKDYSNIDIGLYFYSQEWNSIVDYKVFKPSDCNQMKYCEIMTGDPVHGKSLVLSMEDSMFMTLNLIPKDTQNPMEAVLEYRLVNKLKQQFVNETLVLCIVGIFLILLFGVFLFKALNKQMNDNQQQDQHERENRQLYGQDDAEGALDVLSEHMSEESETVEDHMNDLVGDIDENDKDMFQGIRASEEVRKNQTPFRNRADSEPQEQ